MPKPCVGHPLFEYKEMVQSMANDLSTYWPKLDKRHIIRYASLCCSPLRLEIRDEYISAVKAWRSLLVYNWTTSVLLRNLIGPMDLLQPAYQGHGSWTLRPGQGRLVGIINRCFLLCYKVRFPAPQSEWADFIERVKSSGHPTANQDQYSVLRRLFAEVRVPCSWSKLSGRNGPGSVADGEKGPEKWSFAHRPAVVPLDFYRYNAYHVIEEPVCCIRKYGCTRALQVPKDARGPRFISCEPLGFLHAQFAVRDVIHDYITKHLRAHASLENTDIHCRLLSDREYVTLDLKDASDMISRRVVWNATSGRLRELLFGTRSTFTLVGDQVVPLRTFTPMGSALTFDFMTLLLINVLRGLTTARYYDFFVFGDDIICHYRALQSVIAALRDFGLKINMAKTTTLNSRFRESCGEEWYWDNPYTTLGCTRAFAWAWERINIRPIYLRDITHNRAAAVALLSVADKLRDAGLAAVAEEVDRRIRRVLGFDPRTPKVRWNTALQRFEAYAVRLVARDTPEAELDGYPGLYRWSTARAEDHAILYDRPVKTIRWSWIDIHDVGLYSIKLSAYQLFEPEYGYIGPSRVKVVRQLALSRTLYKFATVDSGRVEVL